MHGEAVYLLTKGTALRSRRRRRCATTELDRLGLASSAASSPSRPRRAERRCSPRPTRSLVADGRVHGIRTGDKGLGRDGAPLGTHEPGSDIVARLTCSPRAHRAIHRRRDLRFGLEGEQPQIWGAQGQQVGAPVAPAHARYGRCARTSGTASSAARSTIRWGRIRSRSASSQGSSTATSSSRSTTCCRSSRRIASCARSSRAASGSPGGQDDHRGRLPRPAEAVQRTGAAARGRGRRARQRPR